MNKVMLIGNLTRDPELSSISSGVSVCRFSIAVNRRFRNANGETETDFFNIVAWRGLADTCAQYLRKGLKVCIIGQIQNRSYEDKDGVRRYATDIIADEVEFLTPKGESSANSTVEKPRVKASPSEMTPMEEDDLPF